MDKRHSKIKTMEGLTQNIKEAFTAVQSGDLPLLHALLKSGLSVKIKDEGGSTLLHHAVNDNRLRIVKYLMDKGIGTMQVNKLGETVLHVASSKNYCDIAKVLIESMNYDQLKEFIDAKTKKLGTTALHIASINGYYNMTMLLLSYGATYNIKNANGKRPVEATKDPEIIDLLTRVNVHFEQATLGREALYENLEKCAVDEFLALTNARNSDAYNLLQVAIVNNHSDLATLLQCLQVVLFRRHGRRPTFEKDYYDSMLLLAANTLKMLQEDDETYMQCVRHFVHIFRSFNRGILEPNVLAIEDMLVLLSRYQDAELVFENVKQITQVQLKLFSASIYSVKLLESTKRKDWNLAEKCLAEMAYVNLTDDGGWTALLYATTFGNTRIVQILLEHGARANCLTGIGRNTPLHIAADKGYFRIVELLIERDHSNEFIDAKTEAKGSTALHIAAKAGRLDIVMLLLKCRATYCSKDKNDQTPADMASERSIEVFFKLIDDLFNDTANGRVQVIDKLKTLNDDAFLAVVLTQNHDGRLLKDVALMNQHEQLANGITEMLKALMLKTGFAFNKI